MLGRRRFLELAAAPALAGLLPGCRGGGSRGAWDALEAEAPLLDLHRRVPGPVRVESIELLRNGSNFFVRARSSDGAVGVAKTKQVEHYVPILLKLVAPKYLGRDARDLERLVDEVYVANYKIAGQPFWAPVAYVEQCLFDLLGKVAGVPAAELLGGTLRREIPVYLSGSDRVLPAEEEVEVYVRGVAETGARAVKFKIGGRMSRNRDAAPGRTEKLVELARRKLGDAVVLYADANGSYDAAAAIEVGRRLEALGYGFFEEPCPWEEVSETQRVADALDLPVAAGEQDSSLWKFHWMMARGTLQVVQPDLNYNGGFVRAARVARLARTFGIPVVPHNTQTGADAVHLLQFAAATPNLGPYMEFPWRRPFAPASWYAPNFPVRGGVVKVPDGPGLGVEYDPDFLARAVKVTG
jgi:L-alanine-DL-glutamate epimerase-like enolase superfamily enzyme